MKIRKFFRILSFTFSILFLFLVFPFSAFADRVSEVEKIYESSVIDDLDKFGIDITEYQKDVEAEHARMLYFLEFGYDYYGSPNQYGLYVYFWNPTGKEIDLTASKSIQIQALAADIEVTTGWKKHALEYVDHSTIEGYENVFYKFKVSSTTSFLQTLSRDLRHYDISGIEVTFVGDRTATEFGVKGRYSFYGFMPYCNHAKSAVNTLNMNVSDIITVDLKLTPVSFKTKTSDKGAGYQYEVTSVYFAVPNDIIRDYGDKKDPTKGLVEVETYFEEYKINGVVTSHKDDVYETIYDYLGKKGSDSVPFGIATGMKYSGMINGYFGGKKYNSDFYFLHTLIECSELEKICTVFHYGDSDFEGISSNELANGIYEIQDTLGGRLPILSDVDSGCVKGPQYFTVKEGVDLSDGIATYASVNKSKFLSWLKGESELHIEDESYDNIQSIQAIDELDLFVDDVLKKDSVIAKEYFMQESEVEDFADFVRDNSLSSTSYLLRFAVRDYYFNDAYIRLDGWGNNYDVGEGNYYFEKTIFYNFDVISLTYENQYGDRTIIPVVCSPINIFGSITDTPLQDTGVLKDVVDAAGNFLDWLGQFKPIVLIIAILIILALLSWILSKIGFSLGGLFRGIGNVLSAPFRLAGKTIGAVRDIDDRRMNKEDRKRLHTREDTEEKRNVERHALDLEEGARKKEVHTLMIEKYRADLKVHKGNSEKMKKSEIRKENIDKVKKIYGASVDENE